MEIGIAQIEIHHHGRMPQLSQGNGQIGCDQALTDAAFSAGNGDNGGRFRQSRGSILFGMISPFESPYTLPNLGNQHSIQTPGQTLRPALTTVRPIVSIRAQCR